MKIVRLFKKNKKQKVLIQTSNLQTSYSISKMLEFIKNWIPKGAHSILNNTMHSIDY